MAITTDKSTDSELNRYLDIFRRVEFGRDARSTLVSAVNRCYVLAVKRAGYPRNGVTQSVINVHLMRIDSAVFGEEVRDAIATGLELCYSARGISVNNTARQGFAAIRNCQLAEDLKNNILLALMRCCKDVKA